VKRKGSPSRSTSSTDVSDAVIHIPIGYVRKAHGIRGDVLVRGLVSDAASRFVVGGELRSVEPTERSFTTDGVAPHKGDYIISLAGVTSRNAAEALIGTQFVIPFGDRRTLDDDEWWAEDLIGCEVIAVDGSPVGEVSDVVTGSAQDRLVVQRADGTVGEVPLVGALVPTVDIAARRIVVDLPEGLFN
jgi:16S rRNA processing protein RimM